MRSEGNEETRELTEEKKARNGESWCGKRGTENRGNDPGKEEHGYDLCKLLGSFIFISFIRFFLCMLGYYCDV